VADVCSPPCAGHGSGHGLGPQGANLKSAGGRTTTYWAASDT